MLISVLSLMSCTDSNDDSVSTVVIDEANVIGEWIPSQILVNNIVHPFDNCDEMHRLKFTTSSIESVYYKGEFCEILESNISPYSIVSDSLYHGDSSIGYFGFNILELSNTTFKIERLDAISGNLLTAVYTK